MNAKSLKDSKLVQLRIPAGWVLAYNTFFDDPPVTEDGQSNKFHNDSQDLLLLKQTGTFIDGKWTRSKKHVICIDVGWYYAPESSEKRDRRNGHYKISAYRNNWKHILRIDYAKTLEETILKVEAWLNEIDKSGNLK